MIHATDISVRYDNRLVLEEISLDVACGEFVGLLGANGSGKSTLLRALSGLGRLNKGSVMMNNHPLNLYKIKELAKVVSFVPQDTSLDFDFTVEQIVSMGRQPYVSRFGRETERDQAMVKQALVETNIEHLVQRSVMELSGGQRQMVFIAKALAQDPKLLMLDEPISALDIRHQISVLELIQKVTRNNMTSIAALHDLNLAARYCDRIILLAEGHILASGKPEEVLTENNIYKAYGVRAIIREDTQIGAVQVTAIGTKLESNIKGENELCNNVISKIM